MAFKMKNAGGNFKTMGSSAKYTTPMKSTEYDAAAKKDGDLGSYVAERTKIKASYGGDKAKYKASPEYKANQSKINAAYGIDDGYKAPEVASGPTPAPEKTKKRDFDSTDASNRQGAEGTGSQTVKNAIGRGSKTYSTSADGKTNTVTKNRADGSVRKVKESKNRSTWDPETGTGSSGLGMQTTTTKRKKDGSQRGKQKTTYSMGTDSKKDDKVTKSKVGKRKQTSKTKNADLHSGGKGTSKTKHYTKGKKAGTSVTKERKKGQLFGKKVDVDYS